MYFATFITLLFLSLVEHKNAFLNNKLSYFYLVLIVSLFVGLKGNVGTDTVNYAFFYNNISFFEDILEFLFVNFIKISNVIGLSFNGFLFVCTFWSVFIYVFTYKKLFSVNLVVFSFLIYFSDLFMYYNMSGLRQGLALSFVFLSSVFAINKRPFLFLIVITVATLFHKSAIIAILLYPVLNLQVVYNKKFFFLSVFFIITWYFFAQSFLVNIAGVDFVKGADMYFSEDYNEFSFAAYFLGVIRRAYPVFFVFIIYRRFSNCYYSMKIFNAYVLGLGIYIATYPLLPDVTVRLSSYFLAFESFLFVRIACSMTSLSNRIFLYAFVLFIMFFKLYNYSQMSSYSYVFMDGLI